LGYDDFKRFFLLFFHFTQIDEIDVTLSDIVCKYISQVKAPQGLGIVIGKHVRSKVTEKEGVEVECTSSFFSEIV
jgi:hypothetical protein